MGFVPRAVVSVLSVLYMKKSCHVDVGSEETIYLAKGGHKTDGIVLEREAGIKGLAA